MFDLIDGIPLWASVLAGAVVGRLLYGWFVAHGERHASKGDTEAFALRLMGVTNSGGWIDEFIAGFDHWFGSRHWSVRRLMRSCIASLIAVLFFYASGFLASRTGASLSFEDLVRLVAVNLIADYFSLWETRWLLGQFRRVEGFFEQLFMLLLDLAFTAALIVGPLWLALRVVYGEDVPPADLLAIFSVYSVFFYSTFITSLWAWLYFISRWFLWIFTDTFVGRRLDVSEKPWQQAGLVAGILLGAFVNVFPFLAGEARHRANMIACMASSEESCGKALTLVGQSEGQQSASRYMELAAVLCNGKLIECNRADYAVSLYQRACEDGNARGCNNLGAAYLHGISVDFNMERARLRTH